MTREFKTIARGLPIIPNFERKIPSHGITVRDFPPGLCLPYSTISGFRTVRHARPGLYTFKNHFFFHINQTTRNMNVINEIAYISDALIGLATLRKNVLKMYC
jgi:hypothetical protein